MQIKNVGDTTRTLSRSGKDHLLPPGSSVDLPLHAEEAEALRGIGFDITGEPAAPAPGESQPARKGKAE